MSKNSSIRTFVVLVSSLTLAGCASAPARRIDPTGRDTITTVNRLDIQDATDAAGNLSESLLKANVLGRNGKPSVIAIDRYINNTSQHIDRDRIIKKIRVTLNRAGVAQTITTLSGSGLIGGESSIASRVAREQDEDDRIDKFLDPTARTPARSSPDYALTFKLLEEKARDGRVRQTTFIFQMTLTDVQTGLAVWEDEQRITKQGSKPSVGW